MATSGYFFQSFWDVRDLSNKLKKHCDTISDFFFDLNHHLSAVEIFSVGFLTFFQETGKHLPPDFGKFGKSIIFKNANREGDMSIARRTNAVKMIPFYFETVGK